MLSYGKRSLQVLECHMKSRYDALDDAVLAVDKAIEAIDYRLMKNGVSGEPAPWPIDDDELEARLFEDADEIVDRVEPNGIEAGDRRDVGPLEEVWPQFAMPQFDLYLLHNLLDRTAGVERNTNAFVARREHDMEVNRIHREPAVQAAAPEVGNVSDADEDDLDDFLFGDDDDDEPIFDDSDDDIIDLTKDDDDTSSNVDDSDVNEDDDDDDATNDTDMSDDDDDMFSDDPSSSGPSSSDDNEDDDSDVDDQVKAPVQAAASPPPNGAVIPPPYMPGHFNFNDWLAMNNQHYYAPPAAAMYGTGVHVPAPAPPNFGFGLPLNHVDQVNNFNGFMFPPAIPYPPAHGGAGH
uniref:Expressed conserved protein n=1 Tax=Panagrellus redivivus TaxID=6233 RepID=A0A7E4V9K4_PANRE